MSDQKEVDFYNAMFRGVTKGYLILCNAINFFFRAVAFPIDGNEIVALVKGREALFKTCSIDYEKTKARNPNGTGGRKECLQIVCLNADVDAGKDEKYPTHEQARKALDALPLKPSAVVGSDGPNKGIHAYWFLSAPVDVTDENRDALVSLTARWQDVIRESIRQTAGLEVTMDSTPGTERALRPPASTRMKSKNQVTVLELHADRRYSIEEFEKHVAPEKPKQVKTRSQSGQGIVGRYLDSLDIHIHDILQEAGYTPYDDLLGVDEKWIRPGSQSGEHSLVEHEVDGVLGVTVHSSQCEGLEPFQWYSRDALYVALSHAGVWKAASKHAHAELKLPEVRMGLDEDRVVQESIDALSLLEGEHTVFVDDTGLTEICHREDGSTFVRAMPSELIRERLSMSCRFFEIDAEGKQTFRSVPRWVLDNLQSRSRFEGLRRLNGLVDVPTLRPDGSILSSKGWDAKSGLYLSEGTALHFIDSPFKEDAIRAAKSLLDLTIDFPFASEADRSTWLAMLLTIVGRPAIKGCVPMFGVSANCPGAGKGLLADSACLIALGRLPTKRSYPHEDGEMRKTITSVVQAGNRVCYFDNLDRPIGGASLDLAITADRWCDRLLGGNKQLDVPMRTVFVCTGNNISMRADSGRRCFLVRLDTNDESPEDRQDFKHSDLLGHVEKLRAVLLRDALSILRAFIIAKPAVKSERLGSFEQWSQLVLGAIEWLGLPTPMEAYRASRSADETKDSAAMLIAGLQEIDPAGFGVTVSELLAEIDQSTMDNPRCPALVAWVGSVLRGGNRANEIGYALRKLDRRVIGQYRVQSEKTRTGVKRWSACPLERNASFTERHVDELA